MKVLFTCLILSCATASIAEEIAPWCPDSHCSKLNSGKGETGQAYMKLCNRLNYGAADNLPVVFNGALCQCNCSCLAGETLVTMVDGRRVPIESLVPNDIILSAYDASPIRVKEVLGGFVSNYPATKVELSNGDEIIASSNHVFINLDQTIVTAGDLTEGQELISYEHEVVRVTKVVRGFRFTGKLVNLVLDNGSMNGSDHVYITNGLHSGDMLVQTQNDLEGIQGQLFNASIKEF